MAERIVLLGTGTCQLQTHRMASSALVELDDLRLIYDFGRGIANRTAEIGLKQDAVEHIVLSHYHPDHRRAPDDSSYLDLTKFDNQIIIAHEHYDHSY